MSNLNTEGGCQVNKTIRTGAAISRRNALAGIGASSIAAAFPSPTIAQARPEKLVFVGDNGPWHWTLVEEVAPAFEEAYGIPVEFNLLPIDGLNARLRTEFISNGQGIDVAQWISYWAGWIDPYMEDHNILLSEADGPSSHEYDWDDFLAPTKALASYGERLLGIPYRALVTVLHYQEPALASAGIPSPPETWDELLTAAAKITATDPPDRYGYGLLGRQGPAIIGSFSPFLYSNGGTMFDAQSQQISINSQRAIEALEFLTDLMRTHKAVPPEATTWEYDEIIANAQRNRFGMTVTLAPYGSLMNDNAQSQTAGNWKAVPVPGRFEKDEGRSWLNGWMFGVPKSSKNKRWAFEFIQMATTRHWLRRSMLRGNAPTRASALRDPELVGKFPWAPAAETMLTTAIPDPNHPIWPTLDLSLRSGLSKALTGVQAPKEALDQVASEWERSLRRAGILR